MHNNTQTREPDEVLAINSPDVVAQVIDGEAILIAFSTGTYYSVRGSGGVIVECILGKMPFRSIVDSFKPTAVWPRESIQRATAELLSQFQNEGLVVADDEQGAKGRFRDKTAVSFEEPVLERFTDLADLLVLDPIHDVDPAGWPIAKARDCP